MSDIEKSQLDKTTFIYTLSDESGIRYVGKSNFPKKRYYNHIRTCNRTNTHKNNWIKSLLIECKRPILNIIDEVPIEEWQFWEKYWISKLRYDGYSLTNLSEGGNGLSNHGYNTKDKMKIKHKEFPNYNRSGGNLKQVIDKDILYNLYINENLSMPKIAKKLGFGKKKIWDSLKEYDIIKPKETWKGQCASPKKIVLQYDLSGRLIKEWVGLVDIQEKTGINGSNIANCCRGLTITTGGFIWRYKNNPIEIDLEKLNNNKRKIDQYDMSGNFIDRHNSILEASKKYNINNGNIQDCCVGRLKSTGGFMWKYIEDKSMVKYDNKTIKSIIQYDRSMNFIKEWDSISSATKELKIGGNSIVTCCKGKYKSAGGFIWKYKNQNKI